MRFMRIRRWLISLAMGGCLLASGCPDLDQIQGTLADNVEGFANDVVALYVGAVVNAAFGT